MRQGECAKRHRTELGKKVRVKDTSPPVPGCLSQGRVDRRPPLLLDEVAERYGGVVDQAEVLPASDAPELFVEDLRRDALVLQVGVDPAATAGGVAEVDP